ncbi:hypothetical protein [Pseudomonas protegens]|uniref:hypothetical protein n=1 Tax=Pseudomonas protegens TaxID=380021 RepID=UPI00275E8F86|nr:hypothetical protein [Pseudomonas protegens]MDP9518536.1 hypothetical protein [Pseudomonas protegens]
MTGSLDRPKRSLSSTLNDRLQEIEKGRKARQKKLDDAHATSLENLAELLESSPTAIAEKAKFLDQYVRTLRHNIQREGGELKITVTFPEGERSNEEVLESFLR